MKAVTRVGTLHPAVAGEEGAAATQRETVGRVGAQEAALLHAAQGHGLAARAGQGRLAAQGAVVGDAGVEAGARGVAREPLQLAVAHQGVQRHREGRLVT